MKQDLFEYLPSEIIIDVISRLPVRGVARCKCVCKSWLLLLGTDEFVKAHISKSVPGLLVYVDNEPLNSYKVYDLEDGPNHQSHELLQNPVAIENLIFTLPKGRCMHGSSDGLLFVHDHCIKPHILLNPITLVFKCNPTLYVCNPITRECIKLHCQEFVCRPRWTVVYGFGKSSITGQHKVVSICQSSTYEFECHVYTLGTGSWRTISSAPTLSHDGDRDLASLDGNLHWLARDSNGVRRISCFNLETELFSSFATPNQSHTGSFWLDVHALEDCLCICECAQDKLFIWLMKEYGVGSSWAKEFVICEAFPDGKLPRCPYPLKVSKDGGLLLAWKSFEFSIFHYSNEDSSAQKIDISEAGTPQDAIIFTPSLLSPARFLREKVRSF